ncbi:MAG TPA: biopolymer transporter ExbD [Fluviicoccus sp.]|nr:biopolymer transporter ExbD [Fluviicoccus sp.]
MAISSGGGDADDVLSEINITPLVDVMLVLLVVFIITAPMMTNAIKVNLPKTVATSPSLQKKPVTVSIDAQGKVYIDQAEVGLDGFEAMLRGLKAANPQLALNLNADEGVAYGSVAKVMALIERVGIERLSVVTTNAG